MYSLYTLSSWRIVLEEQFIQQRERRSVYLPSLEGKIQEPFTASTLRKWGFAVIAELVL